MSRPRPASNRMKRELTRLWQIMGLGAWIIVIPLLSIPRGWANILIFVSGALVMVLAFLLARGIAYHVTTIDRGSPHSR